MDFRKIFDNRVSPEEFDRWRTRYCDELFADVVEHVGHLMPVKQLLKLVREQGRRLNLY